MTLHVERVLADRISPGTRVAVLAVASIHTDFDANRGGGKGSGATDRAVRKPYLRVVGVVLTEAGAGRASRSVRRG